MKKIKIMIVDNESLVLQSLVDLLEVKGYLVTPFESAEKALAVLKKGDEKFDIVLTDINMPVVDGYEFIKRIRQQLKLDIKIVVITGFGSIDGVVKALKLGANSYFQKEQDPELLLFEILKIVEVLRISAEFENLQKIQQENSLYLFHSNNEKMLKVFKIAKSIASKDVNILITGESGTGKEILSRYIYNNSGVKGKFVSVNCSAIPDSLFESSMFGHVKGAFTGATGDKVGFFEQAKNGILLLDEIGELTTINQAKLLKIIEEKKYFPVGSSETVNTSCRIIAATNQNLQKKIKEGTFRMDFYYRLNTVKLEIPPLRERKEDIIDFSNIFINQFSVKYQNSICPLTSKGEKALLSYDWPGNIRQLSHTIERCVLFASNNVIDEELINEQISRNIETAPSYGGVLECSFQEAKKVFEREYFSNLLTKCNNNITEVANISGKNRTYLYKKLKDLLIF
jgi:DNA-binding NtrC family response regulator